MLSITHLTIEDSKWENYNLWKYIKLVFPHYTKLLIIKELRLRRILVNNHLSYFQYKLQLGDVISILPVEKKERDDSKGTKKNIKSKPYSISTQIVFENSEIIVLCKKAGQIVQSSCKIKSYSLEELLQFYLKEQNKTNYKIEYKAKFVHRLDHPVSGLIIGAKTANSHHLLSNALKNREIQKIYKAIVFGSFPWVTLKLKNWIVDEHSKVRVLEEPNKNSKLAILEIRRLKKNSKYSFLEIKLITGRKNQIRAQLAKLGYPIIGDRKYYSEKFKLTNKLKEMKNLHFNSKQIALISYQIIFNDSLKQSLKLPNKNINLPYSSNILLDFVKSNF